MPWLIKALLLVARTRRGRKLLLAAGRGGVRAARSGPARKLVGAVAKQARRSASRFRGGR